MTLAEPVTIQATVIETKPNDNETGLNLDPNKIFAFTVGPINVSRWTRVDIPISLPRDPLVAVTQMRFPGNAQLNVSDNFSCTTAILSRNKLQVNVWRTDGGGDPSINYIMDCVIMTR